MARRKKKTIYSLGTIIIPLSFLIGGILHSLGIFLDQDSFPFFALLSAILLFILVIYATLILRPQKTVFFVELAGNMIILIITLSTLRPWLSAAILMPYFGFILAGIYLIMKYFVYERVQTYLRK